MPIDPELTTSANSNKRPWIHHYDPGVPLTIDYPEIPLYHFLEQTASEFPDRACTILGGDIITFTQMNDYAGRVAGALQHLGIEKGDRVGILMPNVPAFVMAFYGILKAGAVVVATNPLYTSAEIAHQMRDSGVEIVFAAAGLHELVRTVQATTSIRHVILAEDADAPAGLGGPADVSRLRDLIDGSQSLPKREVHVLPDDTALFQYSGGTTGTSKAAVASHRGVVSNTIQFQRWLVTLQKGRETLLLAIPLYHAYGMIAGMSLAVSLGASMALVPNPRDIASLLDTIQGTRPTVFPGVPTLYNSIGNHADVVAGKVDLSSIRVCISGSTALLRETKERFEKLSGGTICEGYGLSEAPVVTHCNPLLGENKIGSIGMPMPDVDCRVVDLETGEHDVQTGQNGELILRGPQLMQHYHNMPEETAIALRRLGDGQTWLFTGDIVRMDEEGYFFVVDRKKELIKPGGFQVWPREVEEVIGAHPAVLEVGVAGVPDVDRSEAVKAWVVLRPGTSLAADQLRQWCKERLAPFQVPSFVTFVAQLPKSNVGKVLRRELVRQHLESSGI